MVTFMMLAEAHPLATMIGMTALVGCLLNLID